MSVVRLIEFNDVNGDQTYDPSVDTQVSSYEFLGSKWLQMAMTSKKVDSATTLFTWNTSTTDNKVSMQWSMATNEYTIVRRT